MITSIIVLLCSMLLFYRGLQSIFSLFIGVICFWGEVIWQKPTKIKYEFRSGGLGLAAFVVGFVGILWSSIVLALLFI